MFIYSCFIYFLPMHSLISSEFDSGSSRSRLESCLCQLQVCFFVQYALLNEIDTLLKVENLLQNLIAIEIQVRMKASLDVEVKSCSPTALRWVCILLRASFVSCILCSNASFTTLNWFHMSCAVSLSRLSAMFM